MLLTLSFHLFQYACNIYAEKLKKDEKQLSTLAIWTVDVIIPALSLLGLIIVTAYVAAEAFHVLLSSGTHEEVDIYMLYLFAVANVAVDFASIAALYWSSGDSGLIRGHLGHFRAHFDENGSSSQSSRSGRTILVPDSYHGPILGCSGDCAVLTRRPRADDSIHEEVNLNMMSAFIHIAGDSLRTLAMIVAATISIVFHIPSQICDAWSAILVTITIVGLGIPLANGIYDSSRKLVFKRGNRTSITRTKLAPILPSTILTGVVTDV